jgi:hypothetical protein
MGGPEEAGEPMDPRMHDPFEIEFYEGSLPGGDEEAEEKAIYTKGKADDADQSSRNENNSTGTNDKPVDNEDNACWTEEELEGEHLPGEANAPSNEETGHGSPQPLDPCDPDDEDDSDSEDSNES